MRLTSPSVQRLLNASERTLVASASAASLKELTAASLRSKIERTRRLKTKYADLAKARSRAGRGKAQPTARSPRTDRETVAAKVEVFDAVLARLETQLARVDKQTARRTAKAATPATATKRAATGKTAKKQAGKATKAPQATKAPKATRATKATKARKTTRAPGAANAAGTRKSATPRQAAKKAPEAPAPPITKGEARALVAKVRRRVALMTGDPAAVLGDAAEPTTPVPDAVAATNTSVEARSEDAKAATVQQHFAATHIARAQGHAGGRTQRAQGKRDS